MAGEDKHSKKHPASAKKRRDLKKKGQVPKSQDVPMALGLVAAFMALVSMKGFFLKRLDDAMKRYIGAIQDPDELEGQLGKLAVDAMLDVAMLSAPVLFAVLVMAVIANVGQFGLIITGEQLKPNINKLNPMKKLKQWFSIKSLQELGKSLAKILVASFLGYLVFKGDMDAIATSVYEESALGLMLIGAGIIKKLFIYIIILYIVVAIVDYAFQRKNFATENKMTDKEVKDEYKNQEGDPYMKQKRRQMAQQVSQQSAQEHVPQSDVVVINPTELAIALKYDPEISPVPWVVAKGEVHDADSIRTSARGAGVPVVRNKPLARALYELCEIGDIVPEDLYRPVAEILAYVFQLKEQALAEANDAALAAAAQQQLAASSAQASATAAAASRLEADGEGVHDLAGIAVPVVAAGSAAAGAVTQAQPVPTSGVHAGAVIPGTNAAWGAAAQPGPAQLGTAPTWGTAEAAADDDRFSWR